MPDTPQPDPCPADSRPSPDYLSAVEFEPPLPEPAGQTPAVTEPRCRSHSRVALGMATWMAATVAVAGGAYQLGRAQWSPPAHVTVVSGARAGNPNYAERVYALDHASVVHITMPDGTSGSGFFYGPDRVVTNAHVVADNPQTVEEVTVGQSVPVHVQLADGRAVEGSISALDPRLDLAVVAMPEGLDVKPLPLERGNHTPPGAPVVVLGHPFGGQQILTTGVLSGMVSGSQFAESDVQSMLLQTDAAVNPGNSGGPLLGASGTVLGMITLRPDEVNGRQVDGLALAIPANQMRVDIEQLEKTGKAVYPVIGVQLVGSVDGAHSTTGAKVVAVTPGSGAEAAGVVPGDIITTFNGHKVSAPGDVIEDLVGKRPGQKIALTVTRAGHKSSRTVTVTLGSK